MPMVMYLQRTGSDITSSRVSSVGRPIDFCGIQGVISTQYSSLIYKIVSIS